MTDLAPPVGLPDTQRATWTDTLTRLGPDARIDPHHLAAYVQAVTDWTEANQVRQQSSALITRDGRVLPNPALTVMRQAAQTIADFTRRFHLDRPAPMHLPGAHTPDATPCPDCGTIHDPDRCDGHSKRHHGQCKNIRGKGTQHVGYGQCSAHWGNTPSGVKAADKERGRDVFVKLVGHGLDPVEDPLTALAEVAAEQRAVAQAWAGLANELPTQVAMDHAGVERVRAALAEYRRSQVDVVRTLAEMARLDLDDRLVAIQRQAAVELVDRFELAMRAMLERLGHDLADPVVAAVADECLALVAA